MLRASRLEPEPFPPEESNNSRANVGETPNRQAPITDLGSAMYLTIWCGYRRLARIRVHDVDHDEQRVERVDDALR